MVGTATFNSLVYLIDGLFVFFLLTEILLRIGAYGLYAQDENLSLQQMMMHSDHSAVLVTQEFVIREER